MGRALSSPSSTAQVRMVSSQARDSSKRSTTLRYMPRPRPARSLTGTGSVCACRATARSRVETASPRPSRNRCMATFVSAFASRPAGGSVMASSSSTADSAWNRSTSGPDGLVSANAAWLRATRSVSSPASRSACSHKRATVASPLSHDVIDARSNSASTRAGPGSVASSPAASSARALAGSPSRKRYRAASTVRRSMSPGSLAGVQLCQLSKLSGSVDAATLAGVPGR